MTALSAEQGADVAPTPHVLAHRRRRWPQAFGLMALALLLLFGLSLMLGSVSIPADEVVRALLGGETTRTAWATIVLDYRLPKAVTALLAGGALAGAGLLLQTLFRNPLADAYVLGISSGASLGVALVVMTTGVASTGLLSALGLAGDMAVIAAAALGAGVVTLIILALARRVSNAAVLLICGLMFGYATSALVSIVAHFSIPERLQAFVNWTYGTFGDVSASQLPLFAGGIVLGLSLTAGAVRPLNALLLGEDYARSLGVNLRSARVLLLASAALLAGVVTAFCGPIAFLGIAVPHFARGLLRTSNHAVLLPAVLLLGGALALAADLIAQAPGLQIVLPLNAVLALFGAPVVIWVVLRQPGWRHA